MTHKTSLAAVAAAFILVPWAALAQAAAPVRTIVDADAVLTTSPVKLVAHRTSHAHPRVLRERPVYLNEPSASDFPPISRVQPDNYKWAGEARSGGW
ncbi:MAG: hypothetical protein QOF14_3924 [Hyphomicrobiales bacterium]|nr:hypothetical protein [Hyphomicrobiales bacterium]